MADYKDQKVVRELADLTYTMWNMGWDEKNGGNISYILFYDEVKEIDIDENGRFYEMVSIPENMVGKYIVITASGSNFRLVRDDVESTVGVILVEENAYTILAGFANDNKPTSEIYMHLL